MRPESNNPCNPHVAVFGKEGLVREERGEEGREEGGEEGGEKGKEVMMNRNLRICIITRASTTFLPD